VAFLVLPVVGRDPGNVAKRPDLVRAQQLFADKRWADARLAFDFASQTPGNCHDLNARKAIEGAVACCLKLDDWEGACARIRKFRHRETAKPAETWSRWNRDSADAKAARQAVGHFEFVRGLLLQCSDYLAAHAGRESRQRREQLAVGRIDLNFTLIQFIVGPAGDADSQGSGNTDWWWYESDEPPWEHEAEDSWWYLTQGVPLGADGRPRFVSSPAEYRSHLGPGAKALYLLKEIEALDTTTTGEHAARALLTHAIIATKLYGPSSDPSWDLAQFYYAYDERPSFVRSYRSGSQKPFWKLADNEARTLVAGKVDTIELPESESPLALLRLIEAKYPKSAVVPAAIYRRGVYYQMRQQFARALDEYKALQKAYPDHPRVAHAKKKRAAILHPDVLLGRTGFYPAGTRPKLSFAHRETDRVEFTARSFDLPQYLDKEAIRSDRWLLAHFGYNFLPHGRWGGSEEETPKKLAAYLGKDTIGWAQTVTKAEHVTTEVTEVPLARVGAYIVEARVPGRKQPSRALAIVTDLTLVHKSAANKALIYVADSQTGRPVAGQNVRFYADQGGGWNERTETSNADGLIEIGIRSEVYGVTALAVSAKGGLAVAQFDARSTIEEKTSEVGYAVTDRPVYRPGDTVHFRLWVRLLSDRTYERAQANQPINVQIRDPKGNVVRTVALRTDAYGGVSGDQVLSPEAALGAYSIGIAPKGTAYAEPAAGFRVEMYKKPEFEVKVEPQDRSVRPGASTRVRVSAHYYFGTPVSGARVRYKVFSEGTPPPMPWSQAYDWLYGPGYGSRDNHYPWLENARVVEEDVDETEEDYSYYGREWKTPIRRGEAALRDDGTVDIDLNTVGARDRQLTIEAEVCDASRRTIRGKGSIVVAGQDRWAALRLDRGWYQPNDRPRVDLGLHSTNGAGVADTGIIRLSRIRFAGPHHKEVQLETVLESKLTTNQDGRATLLLPSLLEGQYRVDFATQGREGKVVSTSTVFWVHSPRFTPAAFRYPALEVIPDRATYKVGETAQLLVHVSQPNARVIWSDEARDGKLVSYRFLDIADHAAVIPARIEPRHVPNFFVEATVVSAGQTHVETCEILVPPVEDLLDVRVTTVKPICRPGDGGSIHVAVTDRAGKPVTGPVTLTAYDKAVTYIQDETGIGPKSLLANRIVRHDPDRDRTAWGWLLPAQGTFVCPEFEIYDGGHYVIGAMGGAPPHGGDPANATEPSEGRLRRAPGERNKADNAQPVVRRNFADTAVWHSTLQLGPDGTATTKVSWPESLTTWRVRAYVLTEETRAGDASAEVTTTKDLLVRLNAPRFLVEGDDVVLTANVHNGSQTNQRVGVELIVPATLLSSSNSGAPDSAGNLRLTAERTVKVGSSARVDWPVRALRPGTATITVKAHGKEDGDAMQVVLPVLAHGVQSERSWARAFRPDEKRSAMSFTVPEKTDPDQTYFELNLSPGPIGAMLDALPNLAGYPYGCTEQTMSRFYPTIVAANVLKKFGVNLESLAARTPDEPKLADRFQLQRPLFDSAELDRMAHTGLNRLYSFQHQDGGWGWWPDDASSSYMTAYVLTGLQITARAGKAVPPEVMDDGYKYLFHTILDSEGDRNQSSYRANPPETDAYIAYVLSCAVANKGKAGGVLGRYDHAAGKAHLEQLRLRLFEERNRLNGYGQALLAAALHQAGDANRAAQVLRDLLRRIQRNRNDGTSYVPTATGEWWRWYNSDVETNSWALRAVLALDPTNEVAPGLARWLVQNRKNGTHWRSTRDSALAVIALAEYVSAQRAAAADCHVVVKLDGRTLREVTVGSKDPLASDHRLILDATRLTPGNHTLSIERTGSGDLQFSARFQVFDKQDTIEPVGKGLSLRRDYFSLGTDGTKRAPLAGDAVVAAGDLIEVVLTINADDNYDYLAFVDPKPACCEPVQLQSGEQGASRTNVELRDERVVFFLSYLSRGQHVVRYRLRAETPGACRVLPASGFAMYAPEIRALSAGHRLVVKDK
jgi:uncharacterized protein YfaS (alpha-2-macroglobulin family)